jgi:manganese/zinc/iron transport system permease protein
MIGSRWRLAVLVLIVLGHFLVASTASAQSASKSITDRSVEWPTLEQWRRVVLLEDYNTRIVVLSVATLGIAAGVVGSFTLLRRRALIGDALAHASLPGIALAFLIATALGGNGKSLPVLLLGATIGGLVGVGFILLVQSHSRLKQDTVLGIVLSVFFGAGASLLSVIQQMKTGSAAGLESFIYGKTASIKQNDATLILTVAFISILACILLFKELKLLCFDQDFADSRGLSTVLLDLILMSLVVCVTMVGLQAVGLILVVALLVIPPAAARFWTDSLKRIVIVAAIFGLIGGVVGAVASALLPNLPSGAMIVLVCALIFLISMAFGSARGVVPRELRRFRLNRNIDRQHLLRGVFELMETNGIEQDVRLSSIPSVSIGELLTLRSWSKSRLQKTIRRAEMQELVRCKSDQLFLTQAGLAEAARLTRQHRLWELYLIRHADIAPSRVDRDADDIEHILEPEMVDELEALLDESPAVISVPRSPHDSRHSPVPIETDHIRPDRETRP